MRLLDAIQQLTKNRPLAALVGASSLSAAGDWLYLTALPILVYERTGDFGLIGLAATGRLIPFFVLSTPAGIIADRFSRRSILGLSETVRCVAMVLIAYLCAIRADVSLVIGLSVVAAAAGTFSLPALGSLIPAMANDDVELGQANALRATLDSLAGVVGPACAGLLVVTGGLPLAFALNGLSFAAIPVALLVWGASDRHGSLPIQEAQSSPQSKRQEQWGSLIRRLAGPLALDGAISFASGALSVLPVVVAVGWLGAGASFTGVLNASAGVGGLVGGLAVGLVINRDTRMGMILGVVACGAALAVLGLAAVPALAAGAMGVAFAALILLDTLNMTSIQRLTSDGGTGRAIGVLHTLAALWMMAGVLVPTVCLATVGIQAAILAPALVMVTLGALSVLMSRPSRTSVAGAVRIAAQAA